MSPARYFCHVCQFPDFNHSGWFSAPSSDSIPNYVEMLQKYNQFFSWCSKEHNYFPALASSCSLCAIRCDRSSSSPRDASEFAISVTTAEKGFWQTTSGVNWEPSGHSVSRMTKFLFLLTGVQIIREDFNCEYQYSKVMKYFFDITENFVNVGFKGNVNCAQ